MPVSKRSLFGKEVIVVTASHLSWSCSRLSRSVRFLLAVSTASESPISAATWRCLLEKWRACL